MQNKKDRNGIVKPLLSFWIAYLDNGTYESILYGLFLYTTHSIPRRSFSTAFFSILDT